MQAAKKEIISQLQKKILLMQGCNLSLADHTDHVGLGAIETAFPNAVFPKGAIHEFLSAGPEQAAASGGFIIGILSSLIQHGGACLWISVSRQIFPLALKVYGIEPDQIIFIDLKLERDVLWVAEEALKCEGLAGVIAEVKELTFAQSRRLQLAVEKSRVTGFILHNDPKKINTTACVARWKITPFSSELPDDMPGVGYPRWNVELLKVRNGNPRVWQIEWSANRFVLVTENSSLAEPQERILKTG